MNTTVNEEQVLENAADSIYHALKRSGHRWWGSNNSPTYDEIKEMIDSNLKELKKEKEIDSVSCGGITISKERYEDNDMMGYEILLTMGTVWYPDKEKS